MDKKWRCPRKEIVLTTHLFILLCCATSIKTCATTESKENNINQDSVVDKELKKYVDNVLSVDNYYIIPGLGIEKSLNVTSNDDVKRKTTCESSRSLESIDEYAQRKFNEFRNTHVLSLNIPETARFFSSGGGDAGGKSSFMTGFGMGFLAFGLKKLLLPVFIGAQLIKSVLIAMFLPSILGSLGKLVGKGLSTVSGVSGASAGVHPNNDVEDFEFKDTSPYNTDGTDLQDVDFQAAGANDALDVNSISSSTMSPQAASRFGTSFNRMGSYGGNHISHSDSYYLRRPNKKTDYKVFHKIPSSSLLLTSYDPFYSPLLSRLDSVFQQLGLGNDKSSATERCRERLVCMMYANPAKYAPYSNLVSAQLSRELNELRKPASDNPDILRFFRYMKAAKDGQDGEECLAHGGCPSLTASKPSPALLTTFNDINKLVQARKLT